jgi:Uma2 family endonuclease
MATLTTTRVTPEEYLEFERRSELRHEYRGGEIIEVTGASREHVRLVWNLTRILGNQLLDTDCEGFGNDMRVRIPRTGEYVYPDAMIVKGEARFEDDCFDTLLNPTVIFEVLSESTETYDRGEKFLNYGTIESLREYVLVAQDKQRIERYSRKPGSAEWSYQVFDGPEPIVELTSIGCSLKLSDLYYKVPLAGSTSN